MSDLTPPTEENVIEWEIALRDGFLGIEAGEVALFRQTEDPA